MLASCNEINVHFSERTKTSFNIILRFIHHSLLNQFKQSNFKLEVFWNESVTITLFATCHFASLSLAICCDNNSKIIFIALNHEVGNQCFLYKYSVKEYWKKDRKMKLACWPFLVVPVQSMEFQPVHYAALLTAIVFSWNVCFLVEKYNLILQLLMSTRGFKWGLCLMNKVILN